MDLKKIRNFITLQLIAARIGLGVGNFPSNCDCRNVFTYRDDAFLI